MSNIPGTDLAIKIAAVTALVLGTDLFHSTVRAATENIPRDSVFVFESGGLAPLRTMGQPDEVRTSILTIVVRNGKYATGNTLVHSIMDSIRGVDITNYLDVTMVTNTIAQGQDAKGTHMFGFTIALVYTTD